MKHVLITSCDHLLHLDSPSLPSELQDNSIVENTETESVPDFEDLLQLDSTSASAQDKSTIEIEFVSESEGQLDNANLLPTDIFFEHHDYELFLLQKEIDEPYDNLSHRKIMYVKSKVNMNSSSMPPTLAMILHYPNSWHNTAVKT